jgi:hypothetical protein
MHPQSPTTCSQQLVAAHSVSRASNLVSIAEDGHVMQFKPTLKALLKTDGRMTAELIGINQASTFTGFCHLHDSLTFELIDRPIITLSGEHICLSAYRAICRELFMKTAASSPGIL